MTRTTLQPAPAREVSLEEYLGMPEINQPSAVIEGIVVASPSPIPLHRWVVGNLHLALGPFLSGRGLGILLMSPSDLLIRERPKLQVRQPDLMYFNADRTGLRGVGDLTGLKIIRAIPDLAIEIISPEDKAGEPSEKLTDYASIGVGEVWLVELEFRTVEVLGLADGRYGRSGLFRRGDSIRSAVLPGFELAVDSVFA